MLLSSLLLVKDQGSTTAFLIFPTKCNTWLDKPTKIVFSGHQRSKAWGSIWVNFLLVQLVRSATNNHDEIQSRQSNYSFFMLSNERYPTFENKEQCAKICYAWQHDEIGDTTMWSDPLERNSLCIFGSANKIRTLCFYYALGDFHFWFGSHTCFILKNGWIEKAKVPFLLFLYSFLLVCHPWNLTCRSMYRTICHILAASKHGFILVRQFWPSWWFV